MSGAVSALANVMFQCTFNLGQEEGVSYPVSRYPLHRHAPVWNSLLI